MVFEYKGVHGYFAEKLWQEDQESIRRNRQIFYLGYDPAKVVDYAAIALIQAEGNHFRVRSLKALKNQPYPRQANFIRSLIQRPALRGALVYTVIETNGAGQAARDLLSGLGQPLVSITVTAGQRAVKLDRIGRQFRVAKVFMLRELLISLQTGQLLVPKNLRLAPMLDQQLSNFRAIMSSSGYVHYEAADEEVHDDLISALALAVWFARVGQFMDRKPMLPLKYSP